MIPWSQTEPVVLVAAMALAAILLSISVTDFREHRIPDWLNLCLLFFGLGFQLVRNGSFPMDNLISCIAVTVVLWGVRHAYYSFRGVAGLGLGDVKMAGASAGWISPWNLNWFILAACLTSLAYVGIRVIFRGKETLGERIPFGPFLGVGLLLVWTVENLETRYLPF